MNAIEIALAVVFVAGAAIGLYAWRAPALKAPARVDLAPLEVSDAWTMQAGEEFAGLSEPERCDLIFATFDLHDERSSALLAHALRDPSEAVALAAAHALQRREEDAVVHAFAQAHPGERAQRLLSALAVLER